MFYLSVANSQSTAEDQLVLKYSRKLSTETGIVCNAHSVGDFTVHICAKFVQFGSTFTLLQIVREFKCRIYLSFRLSIL